MVLMTFLASASLSNGEIDSTLHDGRKVIQMRTTVSHRFKHIPMYSESFTFVRSERRKSSTKKLVLA
jgi:hypothetical protein